MVKETGGKISGNSLRYSNNSVGCFESSLNVPRNPKSKVNNSFSCGEERFVSIIQSPTRPRHPRAEIAWELFSFKKFHCVSTSTPTAHSLAGGGGGGRTTPWGELKGKSKHTKFLEQQQQPGK